MLFRSLFTEDELAVFKRGRNASKASVAKHASPEEYRASTGFECLLGWLYLNGQLSLSLIHIWWTVPSVSSAWVKTARSAASSSNFFRITAKRREPDPRGPALFDEEFSF